MKKNKFLERLVSLLVIVAFVLGMKHVLTGKAITDSQNEPAKTEAVTEEIEQTTQKDKLPDVSLDDWELKLVNKDNPTEELSPELAVVGNVYLDVRIAEQATAFLMAAQEVDSAEHFVAGYQSIDYQTELYNYYLGQEIAADPSLTSEEAEKKVQAYCHQPGFSDHHTGLAVDLSTVDVMNQSDPALVSKLTALAARYGFVLRYPKDKEAVTGYGYEDWHFRYVGEESAKYMKKHHLTLEEYREQLKEAKQ